MFKAFGGFVTGGEAKMYWSAMEYYCALRNKGETNERALSVIRTLYAPAVFHAVVRDTEHGAYQHRFPKMNCYDCDRCPVHAAQACLGKAEMDFLRKTKAAAAKAAIEQKPLSLL